MEIIRKGKVPDEKEAEFTCGYCQTLMKGKKKEGTYISDQREGDCVQFTCLLCGKFIYVDAEKFK